jgi:Nucleotide modification associated domain 3
VRLILSRKGFDASAGGTASPILPNGALCSLPIPDPLSPLCYADLRSASGSLGRTVEELTRGRVSAHSFAHLDPDLDPHALQRARGWRPIFGQAGAAQSHLARHGVGLGDLFLFFGWFRRCVRENGQLRYARRAPDLHALFGWLEVGEVVRVADLGPRDLPWARRHPHLWGERGAGNTLYLAADRLAAGGASARARGLPGAGLFPHFERRLCLTARPGAVPRGLWKLPEWIHTPGRAPLLTHHTDPGRWTQTEGGWLLRTVGRGQEFVIDLERIPNPKAAVAWLRELIRVGFPNP